jgi:protein involved in polysaccharide export with SLBB domain
MFASAQARSRYRLQSLLVALLAFASAALLAQGGGQPGGTPPGQNPPTQTPPPQNAPGQTPPTQNPPGQAPPAQPGQKPGEPQTTPPPTPAEKPQTPGKQPGDNGKQEPPVEPQNPEDLARTRQPRTPLGNPLLEAERARQAERGPARPINVPDLVNAVNPALQKEPSTITAPPYVYGFEFFEPARQVIRARAVYLKSLLEGDVATAARLPENRVAGELAEAQRTEAKQQQSVTGVAPRDLAEAQRTQASQPQPADPFRTIVDPLSTVLQRLTPSVPTDYQFAPGDNLQLRYWSPTLETKDVNLTVDEGGSVDVPGLGRVVIRGLTIGQVERLLHERMRRVYRDVEISVTVKELRTMPIIVSGESFFPGTYQVPSVVTAFNVLYATGGPSSEGSLRRIEVRRRGQVVATFDMYRFLMTGDQTSDIRLESGDILHIPPRHTYVAVRGEVRRPATYELVQGEGLEEAIRYAGGLRPSAVAQRVQITTVQPGSTRIIKEVDLRTGKPEPSVAIYDGDYVDVYSVRSALVNKVSIEGAVDQPGEYALSEGMTVADLVERSRGVLDEAYLERADLYRYNPDATLTLIPVLLGRALRREAGADVRLEKWDRLRVYTRNEIQWTGRREVTVRGAVKNPGIYYRPENARIRDVLQAAGGALPDAAEIVVLHRNDDDTFQYEYPDLRGVLREDPQHNLPVRDRDLIAVYRVNEVKFTPDHSVRVDGEVVSPGVYARGEGMKLSDLLRLAGGLTPRADGVVTLARARVDAGTAPVEAKVSSNGTVNPDLELQDDDLVVIKGRGEHIDRPVTVMVTGAVNRPGPVILGASNFRLADAIRDAGGLMASAYPEAVEFTRRPELLASAGQKQIAVVIGNLIDDINRNAYQVALARSDIEKAKAVGSASRGGVSIPVPGVSSGDNGLAEASTLKVITAPGRDLVGSPRPTVEYLNIRGNVALDLRKALAQPNSEDNIVMREGDVVFVPEKPTTIQVVGAVIDPRSVVFRPGAKLQYYVDNAGGFTVDAARDKIYVIRAGGGLLPEKKVKQLKPGDLILVPTRIVAERISSRTSEIDTAIRGIATGAIAYKLVTALFGLK